eukprot:NODE_2757_length_871_cov_59.995134_g2274_i0.p1 GENE.NODE_2757_length_871_cov_59.995134_g2274_i0~~NODE_2757_length_871_cov_59.995134_g2274_i0.p1  ORF type:complete len:240 (+),score=91.85 NODE_2757_length_871_cov_59.995134_g2274_i0:30-749(+)
MGHVGELETQIRDQQLYIRELEDSVAAYSERPPEPDPAAYEALMASQRSIEEPSEPMVTRASMEKELQLQQEAMRQQAEVERNKSSEQSLRERDALKESVRMLKEESEEMRNASRAREEELRQQLVSTKEFLVKNEQMLRDTKERWESAEQDREKLLQKVREAEQADAQFRVQFAALQKRVQAAEAETAGVKRWWAEKIANKSRFSKPKEAEPWKRYVTTPEQSSTSSGNAGPSSSSPA